MSSRPADAAIRPKLTHKLDLKPVVDAARELVAANERRSPDYWHMTESERIALSALRWQLDLLDTRAAR